MTTFLFIISALIIGFFLFGNKNDNSNIQKSITYKNINSPGMYFMLKYEESEKNRKNTQDNFYKYSSDFYYLLALACQGRIKELDYCFEEYGSNTKFSSEYIKLILDNKKRVFSMAKVSKRIDESEMRDMRVNESTGEYTDRKLLKNKVFMEQYMFFVKFDFDNFYKSII